MSLRIRPAVLHSEARRAARCRDGCCALCAVRCLRACRIMLVCPACHQSLTYSRGRLESIHGVQARSLERFVLITQVVAQAVVSPPSIPEARRFDAVLVCAAPRASPRASRHHHFLGCHFTEQGATAWASPWLDLCNSGVRGPLCDIRIPSGSCWRALLNGVHEQACMDRAGSRVCAPPVATYSAWLQKMRVLSTLASPVGVRACE